MSLVGGSVELQSILGRNQSQSRVAIMTFTFRNEQIRLDVSTKFLRREEDLWLQPGFVVNLVKYFVRHFAHHFKIYLSLLCCFDTLLDLDDLDLNAFDLVEGGNGACSFACPFCELEAVLMSDFS